MLWERCKARRKPETVKKIENERQGMMEIETEILRKKRDTEIEREETNRKRQREERQRKMHREQRCKGEIDTEERWRLKMGGGEKDREKETLRERRKRQADT